MVTSRSTPQTRRLLVVAAIAIAVLAIFLILMGPVARRSSAVCEFFGGDLTTIRGRSECMHSGGAP